MGNIILIFFTLFAIGLVAYGTRKDIEPHLQKYISEPFSTKSEITINLIVLRCAVIFIGILYFVYIVIKSIYVH
jgi:cytochrome c biogenesis factor